MMMEHLPFSGSLIDLIQRQPRPVPWREGEKIPWNDPAFSQRMLKEHLSQDHDAASRRFEKINQQVAWIQSHVLNGRLTHILDLCCGPGLYTSRLAQQGHICTGVDFSPASIAYAREIAVNESLDCTYLEGDIRQIDYGNGYRLAVLLFGEFNVFRREDARAILRKAWHALQPGGRLLLEPHTDAAVERMGLHAPTWFSSPGGLFSPEPHLCLMENFWDAPTRIATRRYWIIDAQTGATTRHVENMQAYTKEEYFELLEGCGFEQIIDYPSLTGAPDPSQAELFVLSAVRI
jgi:SAM-dependent methyltransferase